MLTFRSQSHDEEYTKDQVMGQSLSLFIANSLKGFCYSNWNTQVSEQLQMTFHNLSRSLIWKM
jgi:hypothetical protein